MNNADFERYMSAKRSIETMLDYAVKEQTQTQFDILTRCNEIIASIYGHNKRTPANLGTSLRDYFDGYYTASMKGQTLFLYNVDGQLYQLGNSKQKHLDLPVWDTLPRERWNDLGDCGGTYWINTLKPFYTYKDSNQ